MLPSSALFTTDSLPLNSQFFDLVWYIYRVICKLGLFSQNFQRMFFSKHFCNIFRESKFVKNFLEYFLKKSMIKIRTKFVPYYVQNFCKDTLKIFEMMESWKAALNLLWIIAKEWVPLIILLLSMVEIHPFNFVKIHQNWLCDDNEKCFVCPL